MYDVHAEPKATLNIKVIRQNGKIEEYEVEGVVTDGNSIHDSGKAVDR